jgi:hypothetical protein
MVVSTNVPSTSAPSFANRFWLLEGLAHDEETTKPLSKFQAQGVYKPPHMRAPSESVASATGSNPMASSTSGVHPAHGSGPVPEKKGTSCPHTPHVSSTPESSVLGFGETKIHEELLNVATEEMETIGKDSLGEGRFEQELQVLRNVGLVDEEMREMEMMGWSPANLPSGLPSAKSLDVNVSVYFHVSGRGTYPGFDRA